MLKTWTCIFLISLFIVQTKTADSVTDYSSKKLSLKDFHEMKTLVRERIRVSKQHLSPEEPSVGVDEAVESLKESLELVLMRPDRDHQNYTLILMLQNEIMNYRSFDETFRQLVEESVSKFKASSRNISRQTDMLYVLENSLAYLKSANNTESTKALRAIANANLKISKKMVSHLFLEIGRAKPISPSYNAKLILKQRKKMNKTEHLSAKTFLKKQQSGQKLTKVKKKEPIIDRQQASIDEKAPRTFLQTIKNWLFPQDEEAEDISDSDENYLEESSSSEEDIIKIDL